MLRDAKFWLGLAAIASLTVLAVMGKLGGDAVATGILGLAGGAAARFGGNRD